MAIQALYSAASGLKALSTKIDVTANNLANTETNGFRKSRVNFEDLMYLTYKEPGAQDTIGDIDPTGTFVGLGAKVANTSFDQTEGSLEQTNQPYDVAIQGDGFFQVKTIDSIGAGKAYTRDGNFMRNRDGDLVLNVGPGYRLLPNINIPKDATDVTIGMDGMVSYQKSGSTTRTNAGQLQISQFVNPQGLKAIGSNLFVETDASGTPITSNPGELGAGQTQQNFLETSNVDPVTEMVGLIKTQRAFEMNSQSIQSADQALQTISNLRK